MRTPLGRHSFCGLIFALAALLCPFDARAAAALSHPRPAGPLPQVFPDTGNPTLFYYPPGDLALAIDPEGRPDLRFLQIIYTGTETTSDAGRFVAHSVLSFTIRMRALEPATLLSAKAALPPGSKLVPLPIRRIDSQLIWTPVESSPETTPTTTGPGETSPAPASVGGGNFEEAPLASSTAGTYWTERVYTVAPQPESSQLLWQALKGGRVLMSLSYSFMGEGRLEPAAATSTDAPSADQPKRLDAAVVKAGAIPIEIDPVRDASRLKRIDINQGVPPGYAVLSVRCYDFVSDAPADVAVKRIEISAKAVSGATVTRTATFRAAAPELTSATIRFPVAVKLSVPFSYRVVMIRKDGTVVSKPWQTSASWWRELDITTPPDTPGPERGEEQ